MEDTPQEFFEAILRWQESKLDSVGHYLLIAHLAAVLKEACSHEFHDFKNEKYPAPKIELCAQLQNIIKNAQSGLYDN